jgi:hypothetical protein
MDANSFPKSPEPQYPINNFGKASNFIGTPTYLPAAMNANENFHQSDHNLTLTRKMTFDETEFKHAAPLEPSPQSAEEINMQMKIVNSFILNPFPIEGDDSNDPDYFFFNNNAAPEHLNKKFEEAKNEDQFNIFEPFSDKKDKLLNEGIPAHSSGPIFSLMSRVDKPGTQT